MLPLFAVLIAAAFAGSSAADPPLGRTARIFSTVGHSEFCPAGNVTLDLISGRYALTATAPRRSCQTRGLERPVRSGVLAKASLEKVRSAFRRVLSEGLEDRKCRDAGGPDRAIVISNGGTPVLVLTTGAFTASAPDDLTCWTEAANRLHAALDEAFEAQRRR